MVSAPSSIGYYLHYSVTFHFIERKSIIHCTNVDGCFQASMTWGRMGVNNCTYCFRGCHTIRLWGQRKNKTSTLKHTHVYRLHIDHLVSRMYEVIFFIFYFFKRRSLALKSWRRSSNEPKAQKAHIHIRLPCEWLTYSSRTLQSVSLLFKGPFQMHRQLLGSTCNWCRIKHKKFVLKPSQLPANNHSLHRFLSVFTVGHPSHGVDLLVGPSAGERWYF